MDIKNYLLIEDDSCDCENFKRSFRKIAGPGDSLTICNSATEGIKLLAENNYVLVFSDLHLPDSPSPEDHIQNILAVTESPLTVITDFDDGATIDLISRYKIYDYLVKGELSSNMLGRSILYSKAQFESDIVRRQLEEKGQENKLIQTLEGLIGGIAHQLNHKLAMMKGHVGNLSQATLGTAEVASVGKLEKNIIESSGLIDQLLAYARNQELDMQSVAAGRELLDISGEIKRKMDAANIEFAIHEASDSLNIKVDINRLQQVIQNLVQNSIEAISNAGKIEIYFKEVNVVPSSLADRFFAGDSLMQIKVIDNGCGIDDRLLPKVMDPFFSTKEVNNDMGNGLGLSVVQGLVSQMGGGVTITSDKGKGTIVDLYFLLCNEEAECAKLNHQHSTGSVVEYLKEKNQSIKLLYVEDDDELRELTKESLEDYGFEVTTAVDGRDGFQIFMDNKQSFDCIVTDVKMPKMTGTEMYQKIRALHSCIGFIFVSGYSAKTVAKNGEMPFNSFFFSKPCNFEEVALAIRRLVHSYDSKLAVS